MLLAWLYYRKLSLRAGMTTAGGMIVLSFTLFDCAGKYWMCCLAAAVMGMGFCFGTMVPITIMLEHWFCEKGNTALGICSADTGLSTLGIPSLISASIERYGLRATFFLEVRAV